MSSQPSPEEQPHSSPTVGRDLSGDDGGVRSKGHGVVRRLWLPALCCVAIGLLISLLPDLLVWKHGRGAEWIADSDELLYLAFAGKSYADHPLRLADPIFAGNSGHTMYPWIQFAPGILPAYLFHLGPLSIDFFWRAFAGFSLGLGIFLVLWKIIKRPWIAAAGAVWMMTDGGMVTGQPVFQQLVMLARLATAGPNFTVGGEPQMLRLWRVITPGLSLAYLLAFLFALLHLRESRNRRAILFAGVMFGLLFYVYFYYWTAAALALALCIALDTALRRTGFWAGVIGSIMGLPALISGFFLKNSTGRDWLVRTDNFVPIARFSRMHWFIIPDLLLVVSIVWVLRKRRDLLPVWALAFSGMLLANHQIITGLEIENYHYIYVFGPIFSLLVIGALGAAEWALEKKSVVLARIGVTALCAGSLLSGLWFRQIEAERTSVPLKLRAEIEQYQTQAGMAVKQSGDVRLAPDSVIAGDSVFLYLSPILDDQRPLTHYAVIFSPAVSNREWDRRDALNAYLTGQTLDDFLMHQREFFEYLVYGPTVSDSLAREERLASREKEFREIASDPQSALREFNVRYLALNSTQRMPASIATNFRQIQVGPTWGLWERK